MIARIFCWVMGLCPKHWIPKHYFWGGYHSEDGDLLCPICLRIERGEWHEPWSKSGNNNMTGKISESDGKVGQVADKNQVA